MEIFEYGDPDARTVLLQPADGHDPGFIETEISLLRESAAEPFQLTAFRVGNWNRDLSPWPAPAVFGGEDFGGRAADTLDEVLAYCADPAKRYILGGYSLAGLFALWASGRTDRFRGIAAASPSVWFPGFTDYLKEHPVRSPYVCLSLGDREEKARNPVLASVGDRIRAAESLLRAQGVRCVLEWNEGNHFRDAGPRTAKAFAWVMRQESL